MDDGPDIVPVTSSAAVSVSGGRATTLELDVSKTIETLELAGELAHGNATINPDNTIALVLSGSTYSGPLELGVNVTYTDGSTSTETLSLDVATPTHDEGWGHGQHYMLATDDNGDIIVEAGDNHRKVFVSESEDALSRADISNIEGLETSEITLGWLHENAEYGASEDLALKTDLGMELWYDITGFDQDPGSHWLLFESGYEYNDIGRVIDRGANGEDELHPLYVTSWGEGPRPVLNTYLRFNQDDSEFITMSKLAVTDGAGVLRGDHVIFSDMDFTNTTVNVQNAQFFTLHDSAISYTQKDAPPDWVDLPITQGLFVYDSDHLLIEGSMFHHNGWEDGYNFDGSGDLMSPNTYSHNIYLQYNTTDVTLRDNISSQSASYGAHIRGGGFVEDNVFLDNNVAASTYGGNYKDFGNVGNFTLFTDNLVTSAGYKLAHKDGAVAWGIYNTAQETVWHDNIIAHLADPDNPEEYAQKLLSLPAVQQKLGGTLAYDDTIVYNWKGSDPARQGNVGAQDRNTENLDPDVAMATTIQKFAATLMDRDDVSIDDMMDYLLALQDTEFDDQVTADDIIAYFQAGFNVAPGGDGSATDHRFIPNDLGDAVRWDNRLNWSNEELPDTGDSVDLGGNHVQYAGTTEVSDIDFGDSGELHVNSGKLTVTDSLTTDNSAAHLSVEGAGQFWTNGYSDSEGLNIDIDGGRFANTGDVTGPATLDVSDNGQAILATDGASMVLGAGSTLRIEGSRAKVGFDGDDANGTAILQMTDDATLALVADEDGFSGVSEFRSGAWDQDTSQVQSGISMDGALKLDVTALGGAAGTYDLMTVDVLDGIFDDIHVYGLDDTTDARIIADYESDALTLQLSAGSGALSYDTVGTAGDSSGEATALWATLTAGQGAYDDATPDLVAEEKPLEEMSLFV